MLGSGSLITVQHTLLDHFVLHGFSLGVINSILGVGEVYDTDIQRKLTCKFIEMEPSFKL